MKHLKLIEGLKLLDKEEWVSLQKYVLMYCTKSSDNYRLLNSLFTKRTLLNDELEIGEIKNPIFAHMSAKSFSNLMSRVFIWFEEWLIWFENNKDDIAKDVQLVKIYNRKGGFKLADKTYTRVEKKLLNESQLDLDRHKYLFLIHQYHYFSDNPVKSKRKEEILQSLISYFLYQFKEQSLLYISELHNWGEIQNHNFNQEIELLTTIGSLIKDTKVSQVFDWINKLVSELDLVSYLKLRDAIKGNRIKEDSDLFILATFYMVNFSMRLWNSGKIKDVQIVLDAYNFGLESGVLLLTGKIPFVRFITLVTTLGYIRTTEKTYDFVDKWYHLVDSENQDSVRALSYAQLKLYEGKCEELIPLLIGNKFETDSGRMRASTLELIGLYIDRKNNYSLLVNRIANFKRVIKTYGNKRKNLSYKLYSNFVKVLDLLSKRDFIKVTINIDEYAPIIHKNWLENEIKAGSK